MTLAYLEAVEASAGTGKTFTLAQRVLEEVAAGVPVGRIVVVTFTVAATASLKTRVRGRLRDALRGLRAKDSGAVWEAPDEVLKSWVETADTAAAGANGWTAIGVGAMACGAFGMGITVWQLGHCTCGPANVGGKVNG